MKDVLINKIDPYSTSIGELINTSKLKERIEKYVIEHDGSLGYEYSRSTEHELVFIIGKNREEEELPLWEHPIVYKNIKDEYVIAVDLRKYLKDTNTNTMYMSEHIRDNGGYLFNIIRALMTDELLAGNYGIFRNIQKNIVSSFSTWISTLVTNGINLGPVETVHVEIAVQHYIYLMLVNGQPDIGEVSIVISKIGNSKLSLPINKKTITTLVSNFNHNVKDMDTLVENIKIAIGGVKADYVNVDVLINLVNSSWFGPGGSETSIMALENIPTWYAMLYSSVSNKSYKKSRLAMVLDKQRSKLKLADIPKAFDSYLADKQD